MNNLLFVKRKVRNAKRLDLLSAMTNAAKADTCDDRTEQTSELVGSFLKSQLSCLLKSMTRGVRRLAQLLTDVRRTGRLFFLLQSYNVVRLRRVQWNGSEVCWSSAACAGIHTCRRWHRRLRCGRCSCARAAQWPVRSRPSPRWSGGRRRQSGAHSTLLAEWQQSVSVVLLMCQCSTGRVFEDIRRVNQLTSK